MVVDGARRTKTCIEIFDRKTLKNRYLGKCRSKWQCKIKMDFKVAVGEKVDGVTLAEKVQWIKTNSMV
jgi:hypothetical protein